MGPGVSTESIFAAPAETPAPSVIPDDVPMDDIATALQNGNVYAPADQVAGLREVVAHAKSQGHDVNFVVLSQTQPKFTIYRDIATELQTQTGGTVIVLAPNSVGSASPEFSRVTQEEATQNLTLSNPTLAARQMYDQMADPGVNWTLVTLLLIAVVVIGAVIARVRGRRRPAETTDADAASNPSEGSVPSGSSSSSTTTS